MATAPTTPCQVYIGPSETILDRVTTDLQTIFCPHRVEQPDAPCMCAICNGITNQQFARTTWLTPTKEYVLKDLEPLFATIRFALEPDTRHVFIIQDAHLLTTACANRLLKVLEEPPPGYSFMLLTNDHHALLPTIQSRSTIVFEAAHDTPSTAGMLSFFISPKKLADPQGFDQHLKQSGITVSGARLLVQQLATSIDYQKFAQPKKVKELLITAQKNMPMPGGTTHYLRWLYLHMHALQSKHL